jgi:hypothetical protein
MRASSGPADDRIQGGDEQSVLFIAQPCPPIDESGDSIADVFCRNRVRVTETIQARLVTWLKASVSHPPEQEPGTERGVELGRASSND